MDKRPEGFPKASDLVKTLMNDLMTVIPVISAEDAKWLKDKFHASVRSHRHAQERFGKKWKRSRGRLKSGPAVGFFASLTPEQQEAALKYRGPENHGSDEFRNRR